MLSLLYLIFSLSLNCSSCFLRQCNPVFCRKSSVLEKPKWLDDAMGEFKEDNTYPRSISLTPGISGFALDPDMGFVSILVDNKKRWTPAIISTIDKDRVKSSEALTFVQLAGGLDLGTAVLPPDSLARLVAKDDEDYVQKIRRRISLANVTVVSNMNFSTGGDIDDVSVVPNNYTRSSSTPERDEIIKEGQEKIFKAIQTLRGLNEVTLNQVYGALQLYANDEGKVDRETFSRILNYLRHTLTSSPLSSKVIFELVVNVIGDESVKKVTIQTDNAMVALGLAMRYKVKVQISEGCELEEEETLLERFPAFQATCELYEEAKIIDGFIPSMFNKVTLDNDTKQ